VNARGLEDDGMKYLVIGGGISGMFAAYYLSKDGHEVTVVDRTSGAVRASVYNSGFISPSFSPSPIGLSRIIAAYFTRSGPVYVSLREMFRNPSWFQTALRKGISGNEHVIIELGMKSLALYREFLKDNKVEADVLEEVVGLFKSADHARESATELKGRFVDERETTEMGFGGFGGGVLFAELSLHPRKLVERLEQILVDLGVKLLRGKSARLNVDNDRGVIEYASVDGETVKADGYILAAGSWTKELCEPFGYDPHILPARGLVLIYDTAGEKVIDYPGLFEDEGITMVQHDRTTLRMTSFFEIVGYDSIFGASKKKWLFDSATAHLIRMPKLTLVEEGMGYRPCTPDQLPVVGRIPRCSNGYIIGGTCRQGLTLAPAAAYLISALIKGSSEPVLEPIDPGRFS